MLGNYLKIAIRNILRHKGYSFINIMGLAIGLAIFSLTAALFKFQLSFNDFHRDADRIYSVVQVVPSGTAEVRHSAITRAPLRNLLLNNFPEIEEATRWIPTDRTVVRQEKNKFHAEEGSILLVDSNFLTFFSFEILAGDPATALSKPNTVVLTESSARKYFSTVNAIGRNLTIWQDLDFVVTAVTRDAPYNSSLKFDGLASLNTFDWETNWNIKGATFVRLAPKTRPQNLAPKIPAFIKKYLSDSPVLPKKIYLLALRDLNLKSYGIRSYWPKEIPEIVYLTFVIGIILLLAVCFNFMNLATVGYFMRAREVGLRKVIGASCGQLMWQFLAESVLLSLIAFPVAIVLKETMQPLFIYLAASELSHIGPEIWTDPLMMLGLLAVTILAGIIAGSYPSYLLSRLEPVKIFRENLPTGKKGVRIRQTLIVLQLITAIFSVLVTIVSFNQYNYLLNFDVGYTRDRVLAVPLGTNHTRSNLRSLKEELSRHPDITAVSAAVWIPASWGSERWVIPQGGDSQKSWRMNTYGIDYDFIELFQLEIVQGRSFSRNFADSGSYIINQTAARRLNWDNPTGQTLTIRGKTGVVIGVVKDFHFKNLLEEIYPAVLFLEPNYLNYLYIKLSNVPVARLLNYLENRWRIFSPDMPFEYSMLTDRHEKKFDWDKKMECIGRSHQCIYHPFFLSGPFRSCIVYHSEKNQGDRHKKSPWCEHGEYYATYPHGFLKINYPRHDYYLAAVLLY